MASVDENPAEPVHYKLYGVLYHHGESADSGHYTVDVLHPNGDSSEEGWIHIDDKNVSEVWHESRNIERYVYMLFYCRTAPPTQTQ
jgi:ubiquitin carboxyl-terminal hydrolase 10